MNLNELLNEAAEYGCLESVKSLINSGVKINNEYDNSLPFAARNGHLHVVRYLLEECGADIHFENDWPLQLACQNGHLPVVKYLIERGAIPTGQSICLAAKYEHYDVVKYLAEKMYKNYVIRFDGACKGNPGEGGCAAVIFDGDGNEIENLREYIGMTTNNIAEYRGMLLALKLARKYGGTNVRIEGDSKLVISQVKGEWKCKEPHLIPLNKECKSIISELGIKEIEWIPRESNSVADKYSRIK